MAEGSLGFVAASPSLPVARAPRIQRTRSTKPELPRDSSGIVLGAAASLCAATLCRRDRQRGGARNVRTLPRPAELETRETPAPHDLLLRVARGETGEHTPVWLMRQAGRYMKAFRKYSERYPFRPGVELKLLHFCEVCGLCCVRPLGSARRRRTWPSNSRSSAGDSSGPSRRCRCWHRDVSRACRPSLSRYGMDGVIAACRYFRKNAWTRHA